MRARCGTADLESGGEQLAGDGTSNQSGDPGEQDPHAFDTMWTKQLTGNFQLTNCLRQCGGAVRINRDFGARDVVLHGHRRARRVWHQR